MDEKRIMELFEDYIKEYGQYYKAEELDEFIAFARENFLEMLYRDARPDLLEEIYETLGLTINTPSTLYNANLREITKYYDINQDILEVGSGVYPAFAEKLRKLQTSGSVTAVDPRIIPLKGKNIKITKKCISKLDDLSKYGLVISILPCEATMATIEAANKSDVDLYMMLCGCTHFDKEYLRRHFYDDFTLQMVWKDNILKTMEDTLPSTREYEIYRKPELPYEIVRTYKKK